MSHLTDLLLGRPMGDGLSRFLLFSTFYLHLLFVLIMLGTAMVGVYHFLHSFWSKENFEHRWDKKVTHKFFIPKVIAVVLGVGPLLVIQTYFAVPFFTAVVLFAPFWLAAILLMIFSFFSIDGISHKMDVHPKASLVFGPLGLALLLIIPGIFVLVLVTTESSEHWLSIARSVRDLPGSLSLHWLLRYLHVLGAAMVFGPAFLFFTTTEGHQYRKRLLVRWMVAGLLLQFVLGGLLATTVQSYISSLVLIPLAVGILASIFLLWVLFLRQSEREVPHLDQLLLLLPVLLLGMLLARQFIQQQKVLPLLSSLDANAASIREELEPLRSQQLAAFQQQLWHVRDNGETIYQKSCSFCHGRTGLGDGEERGSLIVEPERLAYVRADRTYLKQVLQTGVPGSAMPYFSIYEEPRLERLLDFLDASLSITVTNGFHVTSTATQLEERAADYFARTCSLCHGLDGSGSEYARSYQPSPPNFQQFSVSPQRAAEVLRRGYPGTAMPSFANLEPEMRRGLAECVTGLRPAMHRAGKSAPARR